VCSTTAELTYVVTDIGRFSVPAGVNEVLRPESTCPSQRLGRHVDGDDAGSARTGDHDRGQPDTPATVDSDPLAFADCSEVGNGSIGGREAAPKRRRGHVVDPVRKRDEVHVGVVEGNQLGERSG
jgi:hypothetical protein